MLLQAGLACFLWLAYRDRQSTVLSNLADAGAILSWLPFILHLAYRSTSRGSQRLRWQIPDWIGLVIAWIGYFMRAEAVEEKSWSLYNNGCILEIIGGLFIIYSLVVLLKIPKSER